MKESQAARQETATSGRNLAELKDAVAKAGFEGLDKKLDEHIRQGQKEFSLPLSYYVSENHKMDFNLAFARDDGGNYRLERYQAALIDTDAPNAVRKQVFNAGDGVDSRQAQNLLAGRAILQQGFDVASGSKSKWIQLDFNDQDALGNHKLKEFHKNYGFDLQKAVGELSLKESSSAAGQQVLLEALGRGERRQVTMIREGKDVKLFVEANPQFRTLNVYDETEKKISTAQAVSDPQKQPLKVTEQTPEVSEQNSRKNGKSIRA
jgi:hypothetical protein